MPDPIKILWDNEAKADLKIIHENLSSKKFGVLLKQIKEIRFTEQYQVDEFLGTPYRRMIFSQYKIIYKVHSETEIRILQIFNTKQNPIKLRK